MPSLLYSAVYNSSKITVHQVHSNSADGTSRHIISARNLTQQFPNYFSEQHAALFECVLYP